MKFTINTREKIIEVICRRIIKYIKDNDLTQKASTALGVCAQGTIIRIKKLDRVKMFRFETVMTIAARFDVKFEILLDSVGGSYEASNITDLRETLLLLVSKQIGVMEKLGISTKNAGISNTRIHAMRKGDNQSDLGVDILMKAFTAFGGEIVINLK